jgi:hypothetical protein
MLESLAFSLREAILDRIAESDGCYILIYSGSGERLSLISSLFDKPHDESSVRLLIDFNPNHYSVKQNFKGCVPVDNLSKKDVDESPKSFCLKILRKRVREFVDSRAQSSRIMVVVDCSPFVVDVQDPLTDSVLAFHKDLVDLIKSTGGGSGMLLYDVDSLSDKLVPKLLQFHRGSNPAIETPSLQALKQELQKTTQTSGTSGIIVRDEWILFLDPVAHSAALLMPVTRAVKDVLPRDPLSIADRDIAFANNYTSPEGACPYLSEDVQSQCLLDPKIVRALRTRGQSFVEGRPCVTAVDHMVLEVGSEKRKAPSMVCEAEDVEDGNPERSCKYRYRVGIDSRYISDSYIIRKCLNGGPRRTSADHD